MLFLKPSCIYEHNALGYRSSLALCLTKVRSSRACCPATALINLCIRNNIDDRGAENDENATFALLMHAYD